MDTRPRPGPDHQEPPAATRSPPARRGLDRNARRFRGPLAAGLAASIALHALLLFAGRAPHRPPGPSGADAARAGAPAPGGQNAMRAVDVRGRVVQVPPPPPPLAAPAEPELAEVELTAQEPPVPALRGPETPAPPGAGEGDGRAGAGRTAPPGRGVPTFVPPAPRTVLPEWDPPPGLRGREVTVRVRVDASGRPTAPVELRPPTGHEGFDRRLARKVLQMEFEPARRGGRPVAAWAELTFVF